MKFSNLIQGHPEILLTVPHFTPIDRVNEVSANKQLQLSEGLTHLPKIHENRVHPSKLNAMDMETIKENILLAHKKAMQNSGTLETSL